MNLQMQKSASAPGFEYAVGRTLRPESSGSRPPALDFAPTIHEHLQHGLAQRMGGGPREQIRPAPHRHRNTRCCEITHSSMQDSLTSYKTLEPHQPHMKYAMRRYHLTDGFKCFDSDTVMVQAGDMLTKTKNGLLRASSGTVTYSETHKKKLELDMQELTRILAHEGVPGGGHAWTPKKLERIFKERTGRPGVWGHYELEFLQFLKCFPRTYDIFKQGEYIRLQRQRKTVMMDSGEDAMVRLARAREFGHVQPHAVVTGQGHEQAQDFIHRFELHDEQESLDKAKPVLLPHLRHTRVKTAFRLHDRYAQAAEESQMPNQHGQETAEASHGRQSWGTTGNSDQANRSDRTNM